MTVKTKDAVATGLTALVVLTFFATHEVFAVWTGSLTLLSLLVVDIVLLWGAATLGHVQHDHRRPIAM